MVMVMIMVTKEMGRKDGPHEKHADMNRERKHKWIYLCSRKES